MAVLRCILLGLLSWQAGAQELATVHGVVLDYDTHRPVARVLVESVGGTPVLTDSEGRFAIQSEGPPTGLLRVSGHALVPGTVRLHRPGYFAPRSRAPEAKFFLAQGEKSGVEHTVYFERAAALRVQVSFGDDEIPDRVRVSLLQANITRGHRFWTPITAKQTRRDGTVVFENLPPRSYVVQLDESVDPAPEDAPPGVRSGYPPVYAPGTPDIEAASVYRLKPGQRGEARIHVERSPFFPVSVKLQAVPGQIWVEGNGYRQEQTPVREKDHAATMYLPNGPYVLHGQVYGEGGGSGSLPFTVDGAAVKDLTLSLRGTERIVVETVLEGKGASPGNSTPVYGLTLIPDLPSAQQIGNWLQVDAQTGERVLASGALPGRYWVSADVMPGYAASVTGGGVDLLHEPLTVTEGQNMTVRVGVRFDSATIQVIRGDALKGKSGAVHLLPLDREGQEQLYSFNEEADGNIPAYTNLAPGEYFLVATPSYESIPFREPGVVNRLKGVRVKVAAGETAEATLTVLDQDAGYL